MKMLSLILTVTTAGLLAVLARAQDEANPPGKGEGAAAARVKELQRERIDCLKALAEVADKLAVSARGSIEDALDAKLLLLQTEVDAARTESDRVALYRACVNTLKEYEQLADARKQAALGSEATKLRVKARRLEVEIRLQQATVKTADRGRPKVVTTSVTTKDINIAQQYACTIAARRHIEVRSLQNGYLEEVPLKEGQSVKQGDVLFKVAPALYLAKLDAELAEAKLAELELSDAEKLLNGKVISKVEIERSQAKRDGAQARAKLAQAELNFTVVRAPFDGLVDRIGKQPGSLITDRDVLTTLSDNREMWAYFNMPEVRYLEYRASRGDRKEGEPIELKLADGTMFPHPGKIAAIEAEFDGETGSIAFRADFPNPDGLLRHGQTGTVVTRRVLKDATVIPRRAAFEVLGERYVYVVDEEDVAHRREIVVRNELEDAFVVERGLSVDDRIVLDGAREVRDGEKVSAEFRKPEEVVASPNRRAPAGGL